jgi:glutamate racemase
MDDAGIRVRIQQRRPYGNPTKIIDERKYRGRMRIYLCLDVNSGMARQCQSNEDQHADQAGGSVNYFLHLCIVFNCGARPQYNAEMNASDATGLPIGVFDSGVGGLTVLKALREAMPHEDLVYLGDTARLPYGTKSPASISRYACQATALLQQRNIKLLVVACNTASAVALEALRKQMDPLPVIGVVEPGASAAVAARPGGRHLVLATEATVRLGAYRAALLSRDPGATVTELACELLVSLAEEGWNDGAIAESIALRYLSELADDARHPESVILGCTHFPLLRDTFAAVFDDGTSIVDSASTTAAAANRLLAELSLANDDGNVGKLALLATDGATRFARVGGQFLGHDLGHDDIEVVDL